MTQRSADHDVLADLVAGRWVPSTSPASLDVVDPTTEEVVGTVREGTPEDARRAVTAAVDAFDGWRETSPVERAGLLRAWHDRLSARAEELAALVRTELGAPAALAARVHVGLPLTTLLATAELLEGYDLTRRVGPSMVLAQPAGVVAAITPWNYPLHQATAKLAPALAAGCTVVLKPSERAPLAVHELVREAVAAGIPEGVLGLLHGDARTGGALAGDERLDLVSFTGSVAAGRSVASLAGAHGVRTVLELGGKSANVVLPDVSDATFRRAVRTGVGRCLLNSGQTCNAWSRLLVPAERYDDAVELAAVEALAHRPGERLGPMVDAAHRDRVLGYLARAVAAGASVATGGLEPPAGFARGFWVRPTVLADVDPSSEVAQEEVFGPVLVVLPYADEDDALALAEATPYGLAAGVWSDDLDHAVAFGRRLRVGQVDVNGASFNPLAPFGGFKASGYGRELGGAGLEEYLVPQSVQL